MLAGLLYNMVPNKRYVMNIDCKARLFLVLLCLSTALSGLLWKQAAPAASATTGKSKEEQLDTRDNAIRKVLIDLSAAINAGEAEKAAALWSEDAVFIDESGEETHGRQALQERFARTLSQRHESSLCLHLERVNFAAEGVALVTGTASRKNNIQDLPAAKFSMALVKNSNSWLINEATETAIQETKACDHLQELQWMIGKWQVDKPAGGAQLEVDWGSGRNFIVSRCLNNDKGTTQIDTQIIGWDPRNRNIASWHFDCQGGFGYGKWNKTPDGWRVQFGGTAADGSDTRATNIFTLKSPTEFTWQSTDQCAGEAALKDTEILKVQKVKPE